MQGVALAAEECKGRLHGGQRRNACMVAKQRFHHSCGQQSQVVIGHLPCTINSRNWGTYMMPGRADSRLGESQPCGTNIKKWKVYMQIHLVPLCAAFWEARSPWLGRKCRCLERVQSCSPI